MLSIVNIFPIAAFMTPVFYPVVGCALLEQVRFTCGIVSTVSCVNVVIEQIFNSFFFEVFKNAILAGLKKAQGLNSPLPLKIPIIATGFPFQLSKAHEYYKQLGTD